MCTNLEGTGGKRVTETTETTNRGYRGDKGDKGPIGDSDDKRKITHKTFTSCDSSVGQSFDAFIWFGSRSGAVPITLMLLLDALASACFFIMDS